MTAKKLLLFFGQKRQRHFSNGVDSLLFTVTFFKNSTKYFIGPKRKRCVSILISLVMGSNDPRMWGLHGYELQTSYEGNALKAGFITANCRHILLRFESGRIQVEYEISKGISSEELAYICRTHNGNSEMGHFYPVLVLL